MAQITKTLSSSPTPTANKPKPKEKTIHKETCSQDKLQVQDNYQDKESAKLKIIIKKYQDNSYGG